jgi:hypothetical protein
LAASQPKGLGHQCATDPSVAFVLGYSEIGKEGLDLAVAQHLREPNDVGTLNGDDRGDTQGCKRSYRSLWVLRERWPPFGLAQRQDSVDVFTGEAADLDHTSIVAPMVTRVRACCQAAFW